MQNQAAVVARIDAADRTGLAEDRRHPFAVQAPEQAGIGRAQRRGQANDAGGVAARLGPAAPPSPPPAEKRLDANNLPQSWSVQLASLSNRARAEELQKTLRSQATTPTSAVSMG
ncbi:hypothetical protein M770_33925 (plasmid) [Pseudomonas aeruginosa VRFPA03]|nr:hypothetical protein M770_33925 [Pseudomonas aeruginosa VRFPA03]